MTKNAFIELSTLIELPLLLSARVEVNPGSYSEFFSTTDNFIDSIDNTDIINYMIIKYPDFSPYKLITQTRQCFLKMLDDKKFMTELLLRYNISIFDLFTLLYRTYSHIFKGTYVKKVKEKMKFKRYVKIMPK